MKILTLASGTKLEVSDYSTFGSIVSVFSTRDEACEFWDNFTEEELTNAYLGDQKFSAIPVSMSADIDKQNGNITARYINTVTDPIDEWNVEGEGTNEEGEE